MSIRLRLVLSFAVILTLFASNILMYLWSNRIRASSIDAVRRANERQSRLAYVSHGASDIQKQVSLLANMPAEQLSPAQIDQVRGRLAQIQADIDLVVAIAEPEDSKKLAVFRDRFRQLAESWISFHQSIGKDPAGAISELVMRAEPLSDDVIGTRLPELQAGEQEAVNASTVQMHKIADLTGKVTFWIFVLSACTAVVIAYLLSRHLNVTLDILRAGAARIGSGRFDEEIRVNSKDELGELAEAFNSMRKSLDAAHQQLTGTNLKLEKRNAELNEARNVSDRLLLNILPAAVADELRSRGVVEPKVHQDVTILFTDFANFSVSTENVESRQLIEVLNEYFTAFDEIVTAYDLEKLKTIGDSYMCAGGLPPHGASHPVDAVLASLDLLAYVSSRCSETHSSGLRWDIRIGIHTGPVIAGVVGIRKFAFDVWGATVNYSSRMESSGVINRINISEQTWKRVSAFFECEYRGKVRTKDHKDVDMYLVSGVLPELRARDNPGPGEAFAAKYREQFGRELPECPLQKLSTPELRHF